jgi:nucleotide-binding universal stress UspA family protein
MKLKTILVPLDGSAVAEAALTPAADLAREADAKLVLLRAGEAHTRPMADAVDAQVRIMREVREYLASVHGQMTTAGVADVETSAWYGSPVESIVEAARYRHPDLIVMSSHGRSGVARLVMGSVTERVLRATTVPILVIRPDGAPIDTPLMGAPAVKEITHV